MPGARLLEEDWKYPYHLDMKLNVLPRTVEQSKYDHIFGPYKYDPEHAKGPTYSLANRIPKQESGTKSTSKRRKVVSRASRLYESRQADHSCKDCDFEVGHKVDIFAPLKCRILIPNRRRFAVVRKRLEVSEPVSYAQTQTTWLPNQQDMKDTDIDVKSWIFTPTHERSLNGNLNLTHNMVDSKGKFKTFIHVLVVQRNQFEIYAERWGSSHVIIELPEYLPDHIPGVTAKIGKVGYARRFIQLFAEELELETIFMLDDNIPCLYDIDVDGNFCLKQEGNELKRKNIPLFIALKHIESQFEGMKDPPKSNFKPHQEAQYKSKLEGYSGPSSKYGVIGVLRNSKFSSGVLNPFKNTHVCGLTFLNISALEDQGIKYQAWPAWEDLTLNNDCDNKQLLVVKYNRFLCYKRNIRSWLPDVFIWDDQTTLSRTENPNAQPTERSVELLLKYIRSSAAPQYCRMWPERAIEHCHDMKSLRVTIQQSKAYKHHIVFFYPTESLQIVQEYFNNTTGLDHFDRHILVFPIAACRQFELCSVSEIQSAIVESNFICDYDESQTPDSLFTQLSDLEHNAPIPQFEVITSHNTNDFKVQMLLVYIEGKGKKDLE